MTSAQLNPTPKAKFQSVKANIAGHHALLENPAFDRAEQAAMLSYSRTLANELANAAGPNSQLQSMINGWKLAAVQEFMHEFRMLAEEPVVVEAPGLARQLNHKA